MDFVADFLLDFLLDFAAVFVADSSTDFAWKRQRANPVKQRTSKTSPNFLPEVLSACGSLLSPLGVQVWQSVPTPSPPDSWAC